MGAMELPSERQIHWMLKTTAKLLGAGAEPVKGLVQPNAEFFPDRFDGSAVALTALMDRILSHAGLADAKVDLSIILPDGEEQKVSCSSGACGGAGKIELRSDRVLKSADGYTVAIGAGEIKSPQVLTTAMVRATSFIFLSEADIVADFPAIEVEPVIDLAAILLGYGVLITNGSYLYAKGCGGVAVHSATKMPVDECALALGMFCRLHDIGERTAAKHLDVTQRAHFEESYAWASSNDRVLRLLRSKPDAILAQDYRLSPSRSWLARALGIGKKKAVTTDDALSELEASLLASGAASANGAAKKVDPLKQKRLEELRALVDESLDG